MRQGRVRFFMQSWQNDLVCSKNHLVTMFDDYLRKINNGILAPVARKID